MRISIEQCHIWAWYCAMKILQFYAVTVWWENKLFLICFRYWARRNWKSYLMFDIVVKPGIYQWKITPQNFSFVFTCPNCSVAMSVWPHLNYFTRLRFHNTIRQCVLHTIWQFAFKLQQLCSDLLYVVFTFFIIIAIINIKLKTILVKITWINVVFFLR